MASRWDASRGQDDGDDRGGTAGPGTPVAGRRPAHPVGWLLLALGLSLNLSGVASAYADYGLLARPGAVPAADSVALFLPARHRGRRPAALGFVLLLTPTGSLPSARWRWWARAAAAAPVVSVLAVAVAPRTLDRPGGREPPGPDRPGRAAADHLPAGVRRDQPGRAGRGGVAGGPLPPRPRGRAPAAALGRPFRRRGRAGVAGGGGRLDRGISPPLLGWVAGVYVAVLPLAIGAAVLRYRLYDLDRVVSRAVAYGSLTLLLGAGYAAVVLGLGRLLPRGSSLAVAAATLAVAAAFQPVRRRVQRVVDRRFNRRRHDAAETIDAFGTRLRDQLDLATLTGELLAVVDQTMQPTRTSLWLSPAPARRR